MRVSASEENAVHERLLRCPSPQQIALVGIALALRLFESIRDVEAADARTPYRRIAPASGVVRANTV